MTLNTTILIAKEVRAKLKALGKKGETYNDILTRLVEGDELK